MLEHILVGLDGSALAEAILPLVETLARAFTADVTLVNVTHLPGDVASAWERLGLAPEVQLNRTRANAYLDAQQRQLAARGVTVRTAVVVGDAAEEIVAQAARGASNLIALATHGRSGAQRWLHGSVIEGVLRRTATPLLVVRPTGARSAPSIIQRIIVCLDGSPRAEAALPFAERLASTLAVPLVALRVVEAVQPGFLVDPEGSLSAGITAQVRQAAADYLAGALRRRGMAGDAVVPVGSPAEAIAAYARESPGSLVVLTTHGRTGVRRVLMGSVALRVLLQTSDPMLLLRSEETEP